MDNCCLVVSSWGNDISVYVVAAGNKHHARVVLMVYMSGDSDSNVLPQAKLCDWVGYSINTSIEAGKAK